ncbi:unnamed protein product [Callosobruchus maculatus]|uniref:Uncharacterized protein n=1 Tax=Callosobruchus maculatus TaxID=64391 RepID=A0A653CSX1_CALMS|nr:unnamed protein product [Callosobruchus maculatus]
MLLLKWWSNSRTRRYGRSTLRSTDMNLVFVEKSQQQFFGMCKNNFHRLKGKRSITNIIRNYGNVCGCIWVNKEEKRMHH